MAKLIKPIVIIAFGVIAICGAVYFTENDNAPLASANLAPSPVTVPVQSKTQTQEAPSQPPRHFEYKGMILGMSQVAVLSAIEACAGCGNTHVYYQKGCCLYGIQENLGGANIDSYVLAFAEKYGRPRVEQRTYRNGLGNEFHANVWIWEHIHESLTIHEICVGDVLQPRSQSWEDGPAVHGRSATLIASSLFQTVRALDRSPPQVPLTIADSSNRSWGGSS